MDPKLAADRSLRHLDIDGRLHVESSNISKACVNPYLGREIPNFEGLGLDPSRVYYLYRDPAELAAAASTFRNLPLLIRHEKTNAENPARDLWVGTTGSEVTFEHPYLKTSLAVWTDEAIDKIDSREQEQLSSSYRYTADMTPGELNGQKFDGVMRNIVGNHVALVKEGRAGSDVVVADEKPPELPKMRFLKTISAFVAAFGITPKPEQLVALNDAMAADTAMLEDADDSALSADEKKTAYDAACKVAGKEKLDDAEEKAAYKAAARDKKARDAAGVAGKPRGTAMDEAALVAATKDFISKADAEKLAADASAKAVADALAARDALHVARETVQPFVGEVLALDSAEKVYRFGLEKLGVADSKDIHVSALPSVFALAAKSKATPEPAPLASDAKIEPTAFEKATSRIRL